MSDQTLLAILSTIVQSMAALIAIGGVFVIYRLETIDTRISETCKAIQCFFRHSFKESPDIKVRVRDIEVDKWLEKDIFHQLLYEFNKGVIKPGDPAYIDYYLQLRDQLDFKERLIQELIFPTGVIVSNFVLGVLVFSFCDYDKEFAYVCAYFMLGVTVLSICSLWSFGAFAISGPSQLIVNNPLLTVNNRARNEIIPLVQEEMKKRIFFERQKVEANLIRDLQNLERG